MAVIDLRSDTVTRPTAGMRAAMAAAEVGDDQYGDDPSVNALQERVADLLGTEIALWLPTGTMANQVALRVLTQPGDDVIIPGEAHVAWHESGAAGVNSGVQFTAIGADGWYTADQLAAAVKPRGHMIVPPTTLAIVENTHTRAGGTVFPPDESAAVVARARDVGIRSYLDGSRLWNAAIATGTTVAELAAGFDLVAVAFSKGLGAPAGSMLAGPRDLLPALVRARRQLGGAMRQAGVLAAAADYALTHHLERLVEDHEHARLIAERVGATAPTNLVVWHLPDDAPPAATVVERCREAGVLINPAGARSIRLATHLDASRDDCLRAAEVLAAAIG